MDKSQNTGKKLWIPANENIVKNFLAHGFIYPIKWNCVLIIKEMSKPADSRTPTPKPKDTTPPYDTSQLERVLGLTSSNNNSICVNPRNGEVVYLAGCFVVVYSPKENKQVHHL